MSTRESFSRLHPPRPSQVESRIAIRLEAAGLKVSPPAREMLSTHLSLTLKWASAISLTSIRTLEEAVDRHVLESVAAAMKVDAAGGRLLDIGSGNGYPAIPIKVLHPELEAILLEPHLRRSVFLRQVIGALSLGKIEVRRGRVDRAEDLGAYSPLGTITMRAVDAVPAVLHGATTALARGGKLILLLGEKLAQEVERTLPTGLQLEELSPLPFSRSARLVVIRRS